VRVVVVEHVGLARAPKALCSEPPRGDSDPIPYIAQSTGNPVGVLSKWSGMFCVHQMTSTAHTELASSQRNGDSD
jgi:hypothetical protein